MPTLDTQGILRVLESHHVDFVVIGGIAAEVHDLPLAPTIDLDITPARGSGNLERLASAFDELDHGRCACGVR